MDIKKLEEVLLRAEDIVIEKVESYWNGDPTFIDETTQAEQDCVLMADEVKRLQARVDELEAALETIAAHDARLLDEAAERIRMAIRVKQNEHEKTMLGKWHTKEYSDGLQAGADIACAAVRGEVEK